MERLNKILVFSHVEFDQYCYENKWNDDNVNELNNDDVIKPIPKTTLKSVIYNLIKGK